MDAQRWARAEGAVATEVDGALVVLSPGMEFFSLNTTAATVWEALAEPRDRAELVAALVNDYDVDPGAAGEALDRLLDTLTAQGAITALG